MITIPKQIKVGYQKRTDTYTGNLAYIVYLDEKGVTKKEKSWEGWRDKKINPETFTNEPTSGFVLNKKVGDYRGSWSGRQAWIRVYDPRNFEFEISVNNLVFILENCSSIRGKGLEGEFVYAWDGKDLLLLPVDSTDYQTISEEQALREKPSLKAKELTEGLLYKYKNGEVYTYLGRHDYYTPSYSDYGLKQITNKKSHIFYKKEALSRKGGIEVLEPKDFREICATEPDSEYIDILQNFKKTINGRLYAPKLTPVSLKFNNYLFVKVGDKYVWTYPDYFQKASEKYTSFPVMAVFDSEEDIYTKKPSQNFSRGYYSQHHLSNEFKIYESVGRYDYRAANNNHEIPLEKAQELEFFEIKYVPA